MDDAQIDKMTKEFTAALRADQGEMVNFLLWVHAERLKARLHETLPAGTRKAVAESQAKVLTMEALRERGWAREAVVDALKVNDSWLTKHGWLAERELSYQESWFDVPIIRNEYRYQSVT